MRNDLATDLSRERYVVEVDGIAKAEYPIFVKALKPKAQTRASELPCQTARRWRRNRALTHVAAAKGLEVIRHLLR
jgi:hypothetical protein